jgi:hypothetical protein
MTAWLALDRGRPLDALRHWRSELLADHTAIAPYLQAAVAGLPGDPLAPLRRQALELFANLTSGEPGEAELSQLGALLRSWGELCLSHAPGRAQEHFERAWACGPDTALAQQLANLYARQGMASGAHALAVPQPDLPPWPQPSCAGLHCQPCQQQLANAPLAQEAPLEIHNLVGGRIWIERNPWFGETHGLAVANASGQLIAPLCRRYPGQWPNCSQAELRRRQALDQLAHAQPGDVLQLRGPVLAVADLSAELHYHAQLELLPRLGRAWQTLAPQIPELHLWHNGGNTPGLQEALARLGVPPERLLCAQRHPQLQAEQLLVPGFPCAFGAPGPASLQWLRGFWADAIAALQPNPAPRHRGLLLARPLEQRRALLQHKTWEQTLQGQGFAQLSTGPVTSQLQTVQNCEQMVAVHGGAMVNLLLAPAGAELVELANPAYAPPYFAALIGSSGLRHQCRLGAATPRVLQDLLYAGPLEWPIDLSPP